MDQILNKAGSYWFSRRANKEISSIGDDVNSLSNSVEEGTKWLFNKLKGKMQKSLTELLEEHNLPKGLFPQDSTHYELDEATGKLTVYIPSICEVGFRDSYVLRYTTTVTGYLQKGKLSDIEGMKTKFIVWTKVTAISADSSHPGKFYITAGVKKSHPKDAYDVLRNGIAVEHF